MKRVRITKGNCAGKVGVIVGCSFDSRVFVLTDNGELCRASPGAWEREKNNKERAAHRPTGQVSQ